MLESSKLLVTGCTSPIGWAILSRYAASSDLWALSRYSEAGSYDAALALGATPVRCDLATDPLDALPTDFDYVLNLAEEVDPANACEGLSANCDTIARAMKHCRNAKAFLHLSSNLVYKPHPDPAHAYREEDDIGSNHGGQYAPSKTAGEGAVRAGSLILALPAVICRANVVYGAAFGRGMIDEAIDHFFAAKEVPAPSAGPLWMSPLHADDVADLVEPSLRMAAVPSAVLNWSGDEAVEWEELFAYVGQLTGGEPVYSRDEGLSGIGGIQDPCRRQSIAGPAKIGWKEGVRAALERRNVSMADAPRT